MAAGEDALDGDDEVDRQVGLAEVDGLVPAPAGGQEEELSAFAGGLRGRRPGPEMLRLQVHLLPAARLAELVRTQVPPLARADGHAAAQVGQGEVRPAVAAEPVAEEREEGRVLHDGQELALAEGPAPWGEVVVWKKNN